MFRPFRQFLATWGGLALALRELCATLESISEAQQARGPAIERLEALELSRHQWEAMCEGLLQKAEGKLRAANNAEARERANKKSYEHLLDPLAEEGVEVLETSAGPVRLHDAPPGDAQGVPAVRVDVAPSNKALAQRAKFGVR